MAGIAFWGGFASGISESIEKNRERVAKQKAEQDALLAQAEADNKKLAGDIQDKRLRSEKLMADLVEKKNKILSGDTQMNKAQAVKAVNAITKQMHGIVKGMSQYAADVGKDPLSIIDPSSYDLNTYSLVGGKVLIDKETEAAVANSNGEMKVIGNEVYQTKKVENSTGQLVDDVDANGERQYEPTGVKLKNADEIFSKPKGKRITPSTQTRVNEKGENVYIDDEGADILGPDGNPVVKKVEKTSIVSDKKAKLALETMKKAKADAFLKAIDQLDSLTSEQGKKGWGFSGILGAMASMVPGSDREKGEGFLKTIDAGIAFDSLQSMRDASPTGGALGQVSERELDLLKSTMTNINLNQEPQFVKQQLEQLREQYMMIVHNMKYDADKNEFSTMEDGEQSDYIDEIAKEQGIDTDVDSDVETVGTFDEQGLRTWLKENFEGITEDQINRYIEAEKRKANK